MSFDNKGRLWVAIMPSYPHYKPGDTKPNDKILIFEDTDNDGKADKQTIVLFQLHGFYVEVYYKQYRKIIDRIVTTDSTNILQPYLDQIHIRDLSNDKKGNKDV